MWSNFLCAFGHYHVGWRTFFLAGAAGLKKRRKNIFPFILTSAIVFTTEHISECSLCNFYVFILASFLHSWLALLQETLEKHMDVFSAPSLLIIVEKCVCRMAKQTNKTHYSIFKLTQEMFLFAARSMAGVWEEELALLHF